MTVSLESFDVKEMKWLKCGSLKIEFEKKPRFAIEHFALLLLIKKIHQLRVVKGFYRDPLLG